MTTYKKQQGSERLSPENSAIIFCDQQTGLYQLVKDYNPVLYEHNLRGITEVAKAFKVPVVITSSKQDGPNGPVFPFITSTFPKAPHVAREGEINAWDSPEFVQAVKATGRKKLLIHGICTDVCVAFLALSLKEEGFDVYVGTDISGCMSKDIRDAAYLRMVQAGIIPINLFAIVAEYARDHRNKTVDFADMSTRLFPDYAALITSKYFQG